MSGGLRARLLRAYPSWRLLALVFYPVTALIATPVRLVQSLAACRVLADGRWDDYNRFSAQNGINSLFYWTSAINLYQYGRNGRTPFIGTGDYPLSRWFFFSLPSLYAYWRLAPIVPLVGMFGWLFAHVAWGFAVPAGWVAIVVAVAACSTTFYANLFVSQNYNALGWMLFPIVLLGLLEKEYLVAAAAMAFATLASVTVVAISGAIAVVVALGVRHEALWAAVACVPAGALLIARVWHLLRAGTAGHELSFLARGLGASRRKAKYVTPGLALLKRPNLFRLALYGQFVAVAVYSGVSWRALMVVATGIVVFVANSTYFRFADVQSADMMMASVATATTLQASFDLLVLASCWLVISPLPRILSLPASYSVLDIVPKYAPFSIRHLREAAEAFLRDVPANSRILFAFEDPQGRRDRIFDGQRTLLELLKYAATRASVHVMPDWYAVFELNYVGAPPLWGRDYDTVRQNAAHWSADFVIVYQPDGVSFDAEWLERGFELVSSLSWAELAGELRGEQLWRGACPRWFLLRVPARQNESAQA